MALGDVVQSGSHNSLSAVNIGLTPTVGNTLVFVIGHRDTSALIGTVTPSGFIAGTDYRDMTDKNYRLRGWYRVVEAGDDTSYPITVEHGAFGVRVHYIELEGTLAPIDNDTFYSASDSTTSRVMTAGTVDLGTAGVAFGAVLAGFNVTDPFSAVADVPAVEVADTQGAQRPAMWSGRIASTGSVTLSCTATHGGIMRDQGGVVMAFDTSGEDPDPEPPPVEPGPPFVCILDDSDALSELGCISSDDTEEIFIRVELQGTGSGYVTVNRGASIADETIVKKGNWVAVTIPQIDGDAIFTFQIETIETTLISDDEEGGEILKFGGRGAMSYMERAKEHPRTYVVPAFDEDGIKHGPASTGNKPGQILNRALAEFQHVDRGVVDFGRRLQPIEHLTHDFDYTNDSDGNAWATMPATAELSAGYVGQTGLTSVLELIGTGGLDIIVWPNMLMQAFNHYGRDLAGPSFATDVVRFVRGVNIAEQLDRKLAPIEQPTDTIVKGQDGAYGFASRSDAGTVPDVEGYVSTFGEDSAALEAIGESDMARRIRQGESVQFQVTVPRFGVDPDPLIGLYLPGPPGTNGQYWIGDTVALDTGNGFRDFDDVEIRVFAITILISNSNPLSAAGDLVVIPELAGTTFASARFGGVVGGFSGSGSGGSVSAGGTGGGSPAGPDGGSLTTGHVLDATDAHDASAISVDGSGFTNIPTSIDDVQEALEELDAAIGDVSGEHDDLTGRSNVDNHTTYLTNLSGEGHVQAVIADAGATETLDLSTANVFDITLTTGCTLTLTAPTDDGKARVWSLVFRGEFDVTWPGTVVWMDGGGTAPDAAETLGVEIATLDGGASYLASAGRGAGTGAPSGPAGGDLSGTYPNPSVVDDSHNHTGATAPSGVGPILISDDHSTPIVFGDILLTEDQDDILYADAS